MRLVLMIMLILLAVSGSAQEQRKFQIWNLSSVSVNLSEHFALEVSEKIHYTPEANRMDLKFGDVRLKHEPNKGFQYGGGFRLLYLRNETGWTEERRPVILADFSREIGKLEISFSNRWEYRMFKTEEDHFRYREMMNIDFPTFSKLKLNFYVSEEAFCKMNGDGLHLARFYTGISTINSDHFEVKIYYVLEKSKYLAYWNTNDVIGLNMKISL